MIVEYVYNHDYVTFLIIMNFMILVTGAYAGNLAHNA